MIKLKLLFILFHPLSHPPPLFSTSFTFFPSQTDPKFLVLGFGAGTMAKLVNAVCRSSHPNIHFQWTVFSILQLISPSEERMEPKKNYIASGMRCQRAMGRGKYPTVRRGREMEWIFMCDNAAVVIVVYVEITERSNGEEQNGKYTIGISPRIGREAGAESTVEDEEYAGVFRINTASSGARVRSGWVGLWRRGRLLWGRGAALASTRSFVSFIFGVYFPKRRWNEKREMKKRRNFFHFPTHSVLTHSLLLSPISSHHRRRHQSIVADFNFASLCLEKASSSILSPCLLIPFLDYFFSPSFLYSCCCCSRLLTLRHILWQSEHTKLEKHRANGSSIPFNEMRTKKKERRKNGKARKNRGRRRAVVMWKYSGKGGKSRESRLTSTKNEENCYEKARDEALVGENDAIDGKERVYAQMKRN